VKDRRWYRRHALDSCFGPAYEFASSSTPTCAAASCATRCPSLRHSEPYIGHLGLGGVGDSKSMLESDMRATTSSDHQRQDDKVEAGKLYATSSTTRNVFKEHELPSRWP